ncbi:ATP synthase delta subunit-domain-containing protein [Spinellus fusiger]|nr:ATP synthase delta subunit-domain-containing protein [Spinellus fusiger]
MASRFARLTATVPQSARAYATPAKAPKVPVTLFGLNGRYATALYSAAARKNALEQVEKDLKQLSVIVSKDKSVQALLENPTINRNNKLQQVFELLQKSGKPDAITKNLFETLLRTVVLTKPPNELMSAHRQELPLVITSSKELDKATLNKIADALQKSSLAEGKKLLVSNKVKSDILGGLLVEIGDKSIDLTVSTKLAKLNKVLTDVTHSDPS